MNSDVIFAGYFENIMKSKYPVFSFLKYSILLVFSLFKTTGLFSQNNGIQITLHESEVSPLSVFKEIENQCDLHFIYDEQGVDSLNQELSIDCDGETLNYVLNAIEKQTRLSFRVYDKSIAVTIKKKRINISGFVTDSLTGDYLIGAVVFMLGSNVGATTNENGYYSMSVPTGNNTIIARYIGYNSFGEEINEEDDNLLNFRLIPKKTLLNEVVVSDSARKDSLLRDVNGVTTIVAGEINKLPSSYSDPDIVKSTYNIPGILRLNQGSCGYSVRGASSGENLILFDNVPMYNVSHRFVDLSVFNPDIIQSMSLYKGGIPTEYGGGNASVLNITSRNGDLNHFHLKGGVNPISSRLSIEGPVWPGKISFLFSARVSYDEWLKKFNDDISKCEFYDVNAKLHYKINDRNDMSYSLYLGKDVVDYKMNATIQDQKWVTSASSFNLNNWLGDKLTMHTSLFFSEYDYKWYNGDSIGIHGYIDDLGGSQNYAWVINMRNKFDFGWNMKMHFMNAYCDENSSSISEYSFYWHDFYELYFYTNNQRKVGDKINVNYGVRISSLFNNHSYNNDSDSIVGSVYEYTSNNVFFEKFHSNFYIALNYKLSSSKSIKVSFNHSAQEMHQVSYLTNSLNHYFIWVPSFYPIKPIITNQISMGYYLNTPLHNFSYSVEAYVKNSKNNWSYFSDTLSSYTSLDLETDLILTRGKSYGLELAIYIDKDRLKGSLAYTLSKSLRQSDEVNNGDWFNSNYDRPNNIALNFRYDLLSKLYMTLNLLYSTGMPTSLTYSDLKNGTGVFDINHINKYRLPDYHRMDLGLVYNINNPDRKFQSSLSLNIYNVYNRNNKYINEGVSQSTGNYNNTNMLSDYSIMPTLSYRFSF